MSDEGDEGDRPPTTQRDGKGKTWEESAAVSLRLLAPDAAASYVPKGDVHED